jgi:DNA uptake protein ComE-like DNA-binding protein
MLGEDDEETTAGTGTTQVATVPPGSAGGAAANPVTGATTNVPFSQPLAEGDASSIPGTPAYDPAAQAEVERDAAARQHAAERADTGGGAGDTAGAAPAATAGEEATVPTSDGDGDIVELREPAVPGISEAQRKALVAAGFRTADAIRGATDEQLLAVDGVGPKTVEALREATKA